MVIRGNQWSSEAINGHQRLAPRVSTHPAKKSVAIAAAHADEMSADLMREAINGHPRASVVIRGNQWSSQAREVGGLGDSDEGWWG